MLNPTPEEIIKAIGEVNPAYYYRILDFILERLNSVGRYKIIRELKDSTWKIECLNPHTELYPKKLL